MVKYPLWVQKLLYYMIQHGATTILTVKFQQMSISPKQAFSLHAHVFESTSDDYNF